MPEISVFQRLRERKLVQWGLAYVAAAWLLLEILGHAGATFGWPEAVDRIGLIVAGFGFLVVLVLAWYHGDMGKQRISGPELLIIALLLAIGGGVVSILRPGGEDGPGRSAASPDLTASSPALVENRVAVMPFENRTDREDLGALGAIIADVLTQGLSRTEMVEVVPTSVTIGFASEAGPDGYEVMVDGEARTLADETKAGTVVRGAYYLLGDSLRIQAEISDEETKSVLSAVDIWGQTDRPMEAVGELGQRVMSHLALRFDPRLVEEGAAMLMGGTLPRYEAYSAYMESMDAAYGLSQDIREMLRHANRAFELDSTFFVPLAGTLYGHVSLGNIREADSLIGFLEANQDRLDPFSVAAMGVMKSRLRGDLDGEYRTSRDWLKMQPDFGQGLWQLGWAALNVNRPHEALEALNRANPRSWSLRGEWAYWASLTEALHLLGRHEVELSAAQRGRDQFPESPNALLYELRALSNLGRVDQVVGGLDELISLSSGSPTGRLREVAQELQVHGQREAAREVLDRIFAWYMSRPPSELETQASRFDRGITHYLAGEWDEADHLFSLVEAGEPSESRAAEAQRLFHGPGHRGVIAARRGDREEALRISQGLSVAEMAYSNGRDDFCGGRIAAVLGDREEAMAFLLEAHAHGQAFGLSWHRDPALESLRDYPPFQEFLRPKG